MGDEQLGLMAMGNVFGEAEIFFSGLAVKQTTYTLVRLSEVCMMHNRTSWGWGTFLLQGQRHWTYGLSQCKYGVQLFSGLSPICPTAVSGGGPIKGQCTPGWGVQCYCSTLFDPRWDSLSGFDKWMCWSCSFGCDGMALGSPVEVFYQLHTEVLGHLNLSKNLAMEGLVSDSLLFLAGVCHVKGLHLQ